MRIASNTIVGAVVVAARLASPALAMPHVVDREDPPPYPPPAPPAPKPDTTGGPDAKPPIPITVQLFGGPPGVKGCRGGSRLVDMELPRNASTTPRFTRGDLGQCYDLPGTAQCGVFMGNRADGCEARLFRGQKCTSLANVAVFRDEPRPVGGFFASMAIKCGIEPVEVRPLSLGGLGGAVKMQKPQTKGEGKARDVRAVDAAMRAGLSQEEET